MKQYVNASSVPTITADQIDQLYIFTRKHFVEHYDIQTELVDHLANGIEQQWLENPTLSFDEALSLEFKKFGIFGFSDIVEKRQAQMEKRYHKFVWEHFKDFFSIPKLFFSLSLVVLVTIFLTSLNSEFIEIAILLIYSISLILGLVFMLYRRNKTKENKIEKRWLMKELIDRYGNSSAFWFIPIQLSNLIFSRVEFDFYMSLFISFILVSSFLYSYIMIFILPKKSEEYLLKVYPEYAFSK